MKLCLIRGIFFAAISIVSACATIPEQSEEDLANNQETAKPAKPFVEEPGDVSFDHPTADIMYEVLIAELATQRGAPDVASKFYVDAAKTSKDPRIASRAVRIASFADNKQDALEAAKIWSENEPENQEAQRVLSVLYLRNGEFQQAQKLLGDTLKENPGDISRNLLLTGALLQREASSEGALKIAKHLVELYPNEAESHYVLASLAMQAKLKEQALESIEKSIKIRPNWVEAVVLYPRILQENGKTDEALTYMKGYIKQNPKADNVRLNYARALVDARQLEEARSQFELLAVKMPNNQDVLFALAMLSMQFKDFDEAEAYLQQLNKQGKSNPQVLFYLGQISEQKENHEAAINFYSKIFSGDYHLEAQLRISVILAKTKSIKEATDHLKTISVNSDEEKREINLFKGNLLRDFKHYQEAFDFYSKLLEEAPKDPDYLYFRSLVAEKLDRIDIVIRDLSFVIEQDPENAAALNALGYTLADRTNKLDEALKLILRARELEPDDPAIIDSLGWVNYRMGKFDDAEKYLSEAMEKIDDAEVSAHYGEVLWQKGDKEKAIDVWKSAKEKFKDNEILEKTMERFGQ